MSIIDYTDMMITRFQSLQMTSTTGGGGGGGGATPPPPAAAAAAAPASKEASKGEEEGEEEGEEKEALKEALKEASKGEEEGEEDKVVVVVGGPKVDDNNGAAPATSHGANMSPNQILKALWLGPAVSFNVEYQKILKEAGVTHVCNCTENEPFLDGLVGSFRLSVKDEENADIASQLDGAVDFLRESIEGGGIVYVHCAMGVSRSATVVIAYRMVVLRETLRHAYVCFFFFYFFFFIHTASIKQKKNVMLSVQTKDSLKYL